MEGATNQSHQDTGQRKGERDKNTSGKKNDAKVAIAVAVAVAVTVVVVVAVAVTVGVIALPPHPANFRLSLVRYGTRRHFLEAG